MKNHWRILAAELRQELENLDRLAEELGPLLPSDPQTKPPAPSVRAIGSIIHDFYNGVEKVFRRVAQEIDEEVPKGESWHLDLLQRMAIEVPEVRPALISRELAETLSEYLRFRHLFRNVYSFQIRWDRFAHLARGMKETLQQFRSELKSFVSFLQGLPDED